MTKRSDIDRVLETWFRDGPTTMPDRVIDVVADRIARQPQRRSWLAGRTTMSKQIQLVAALAAVIVVAVVGYNLLPGSDTGGPGPTPTPTLAPTPTPSAAPTASANFPSWYTESNPTGAGILPSGVQATRAFEPAFSFSVPEGWVNNVDEGSYFFLFPDTPSNQALFARSENLAQVIMMGVHPTPWFTCESLENNRGATAAERVAAAAANEVLATSDQVDVAIGGLTGMQFDVRRNPDWTGACPADSSLPAEVDPEDERSRVIFLDIPGRGVLGIILYSMSSAEHEALLGEAMPIIESLEFDLPQ